MTIKTFDSESFCGYKQITTFYTDFSIADNFGVRAIKDTYKRALEWLDDVKYFTELVMVLNWKSWEHVSNDEYCELYTNLFYEAQDMAYEHFKGDDLTYFIRTTD